MKSISRRVSSYGNVKYDDVSNVSNEKLMHSLVGLSADMQGALLCRHISLYAEKKLIRKINTLLETGLQSLPGRIHSKGNKVVAISLSLGHYPFQPHYHLYHKQTTYKKQRQYGKDRLEGACTIVVARLKESLHVWRNVQATENISVPIPLRPMFGNFTGNKRVRRGLHSYVRTFA
jgi:hypothetical protein